jgi:hypothetical protein
MPASAMPVKTLRQWSHFFRAAGAAGGADGSGTAAAGAAGVFRSPDGRGRFDLL